MIVDLVANGLCDLWHILGDGVHHLKVLLAQPQTFTDGLKLIGASRILSTCHRGSEVVADDHCDISILIDSIQQSGHTAMGKGRVADDSHSRPLTCIAGSLGHRDRGSHIHTAMDGLVGWQETEGIATDITKHTGIGILTKHLVKGGIDITVTTALTECWRTWGDILTGSIALTALNTKCSLQEIRIKLTGTRQLTCQTTLDDSISWHHATHLILDEGLTLFGYQHLLAIVGHPADQRLGNRILRNLQHRERTTLRIAFHQVVIGDTAGDDTQLMVGAIDILIIFALYCHLLQYRLLTRYDHIALTGKGWQQHPVGSLRIVVKRILLAWLILNLYYCTTMGHTGGDTHQDGQMQLLRQVERLLHHVVSLLLRAGLERRNHRKLSIEARVLLVLRRVHRGVVGNQDHYTTVCSRHG